MSGVIVCFLFVTNEAYKRSLYLYLRCTWPEGKVPPILKRTHFKFDFHTCNFLQSLELVDWPKLSIGRFQDGSHVKRFLSGSFSPPVGPTVYQIFV